MINNTKIIIINYNNQISLSYANGGFIVLPGAKKKEKQKHILLKRIINHMLTTKSSNQNIFNCS